MTITIGSVFPHLWPASRIVKTGPLFWIYDSLDYYTHPRLQHYMCISVTTFGIVARSLSAAYPDQNPFIHYTSFLLEAFTTRHYILWLLFCKMRLILLTRLAWLRTTPWFVTLDCNGHLVISTDSCFTGYSLPYTNPGKCRTLYGHLPKIRV